MEVNNERYNKTMESCLLTETGFHSKQNAYITFEKCKVKKHLKCEK